MNPIWRATMEMSKSRSETQKQFKKRQEMKKDRTRKEKERRRVEALERDRQRFIVGQELIPDELDKEEELEELQESAAEKFQKELCWCIQQTQVGLANIKPSAKEAKPQTEEAQKLLRILTSTKAPMAKKRQVMRATFGDYRSKMQQEERKHKADMSKRLRLEQASPRRQGLCTFFRMSTTADIGSSPQILASSNDLPGEAGSSGHGSRSLGHDPGSLGREMGSSPCDLGSPGRDEGVTLHEQGMMGHGLGMTSGHDLGSSGDDWLKNEAIDSSMQELEHSTESMHILNPVCKETQSKTLDNTRSQEWEQKSKNENVVNERKNSHQDEESNESGLKSRKAAKPPNLSLNVKSETQPFSFNFAISQEDLDRQEARPTRGSNNKNIEGSQSDTSTPEKGPGSGRRRPGSRKRNKAKKKQQVMMRDKEATVAAGNQKLQLEVDGGFMFNFPDPVEQPATS